MKNRPSHLVKSMYHMSYESNFLARHFPLSRALYIANWEMKQRTYQIFWKLRLINGQLTPSLPCDAHHDIRLGFPCHITNYLLIPCIKQTDTHHSRFRRHTSWPQCELAFHIKYTKYANEHIWIHISIIKSRYVEICLKCILP